jgi:hypothetical protein
MEIKGSRGGGLEPSPPPSLPPWLHRRREIPQSVRSDVRHPMQCLHCLDQEPYLYVLCNLE